MIRRPPLRIYPLAWVPLAAVYAALFAAAGTPPGKAIAGAVLSVVPFAALGAAVLGVPGALPWRDERRVGFLAAHLALALAYAVVGTAAVTALRFAEALLVSRRAGVPLNSLNLAWQVVVGALLYLVVAGGAYAWDNAERVREEAARAAHADALRARAELAALRSQVNPHFLLNTLHAALGLIRRDPGLAEKALERLGEVLLYGLRMHRDSLDEVAFMEEWAFVRAYLEIEGLRLGERLRLRLDADEAAMVVPVPPFVLQPLVENAIRHAIAPRAEGGSLEVAIRLDGDRLQLAVRDDGPGPPAGSAGGSGLGLRLLRERLAMLYGGDAHLQVDPAAGGGTRAVVDLPRGGMPDREPE